MAIGAYFSEVDSHDSLANAATTAGYYFSFINGAVYSEFDRELFQETLNDWGFFGTAENRPEWLADSAAVPATDGAK
jgi:hypothetical protein